MDLQLRPDDPLAVALVSAIRAGDLGVLERMLGQNPAIATAGIDDGRLTRTLLHVATDWPGHFPNNPATVELLISHGANVNAPAIGRHSETPLHWAASTDDVEVLDLLLDRGADIEAPGSVIGGGAPLADAVAFGQWKAARRLVERGARKTLWQAAALGIISEVEEFFAHAQGPSPEAVTNAFWCACHGGQQETAGFLLERGADINWIGYDDNTPLDAANRSGAGELAAWLRSRGATSAHS